MTGSATPPEPTTLEFKRVRIDDQELCYQESGDGNRPMLLLHTFRTQIEHHQRIVPHLSDYFRIFAVDLPGHGRSSKSRSTVHDATYFVSSVRKFIEHIGLTDLTILGESIGGTITLCLAAEIPERLSSVFSCNPYDYPTSIIGSFLGKQVSFIGRFSTIVTYPATESGLRMVFATGFHDSTNIPNGYMKLLTSVPLSDRDFPAGIKSVFKNFRSWSKAADTKYAQIPDDLPVNVIYGDSDWGPRSSSEVNRQRLKGNVRFTFLTNTGHFAFLDNPEGVVEVVLRELGQSVPFGRDRQE